MTRITSRHSHGDISSHQGDPFLEDETTHIIVAASANLQNEELRNLGIKTVGLE